MSRSILTRRLVAVVALVGAFAASAFVTREAQARVPSGPRLDSVSEGCGRLQDEYDQAVRALGAAQKGTQAEYDAAFRRVQSLQAQWAGSPCARAFGSIIFYVPPSSTGKPGLPTLAQPVMIDGISKPSKPPMNARDPNGRFGSVLKKN